MSSDPLISVKGLGKVYHIYDNPKDRFYQTFLGRWKTYHREFWALREINFDVRPGESVGFLGCNGAGKSTLLQLICGTLKPTEGEVRIRGRISALLELGAGFNPEFTGLDNIYIYGAVLGLSKAEIDHKLDRTIAFADIGQFINLPVKTYSSGMVVRLAFSVAINVEPDILVVDEALAVGDARFTARCMTQIGKMKDNGTSILFVGHDTSAITKLCSSSYVLHEGRVVNSGTPQDVVSWYMAFSSSGYDRKWIGTEPENIAPEDNLLPKISRQFSPESSSDGEDLPEFKLFRYGDGNAEIVNSRILDTAGQRIDIVVMGETVTFEFTSKFAIDLAEHGVGFYIKNRLGTHVVGINTFQEKTNLPEMYVGDTLVYKFTIPLELEPGFYTVSPSIAYSQVEHKWMDYIENAILFQVVDPEPQRQVFGIYYPSERKVAWHRG